MFEMDFDQNDDDYHAHQHQQQKDDKEEGEEKGDEEEKHPVAKKTWHAEVWNALHFSGGSLTCCADTPSDRHYLFSQQGRRCHSS
jgi:hypothetical protein